MRRIKREIESHSRRAVAATEMALILPVLMLIVLGAVDFGRFAHAHIAVTNAARAGAGYGIMNPYTTTTESLWQTNVRSAVLEEMSHVVANSSFSDSDVNVETGRTIEISGMQRINITVSFPFQTIVPWPGIPNQVTMSRRIVMRVIR